MKHDPKRALEYMQGALRVLLMAAVTLFVIQYFVQPMVKDKANDPQVLKFATKIEPLSVEDLSHKIKASKGTPLMVMLYASWCGSCKATMPHLIELLRSDTDRLAFNVLAVSVDQNLIALSSYLVKTGYGNDFIPYIYKGSNAARLPETLGRLGMKYRSRIPYIAIFAADGSLSHESTGGINAEALREALFAAMTK